MMISDGFLGVSKPLKAGSAALSSGDMSSGKKLGCSRGLITAVSNSLFNLTFRYTKS